MSISTRHQNNPNVRPDANVPGSETKRQNAAQRLANTQRILSIDAELERTARERKRIYIEALLQRCVNCSGIGRLTNPDTHKQTCPVRWDITFNTKVHRANSALESAMDRAIELSKPIFECDFCENTATEQGRYRGMLSNFCGDCREKARTNSL